MRSYKLSGDIYSDRQWDWVARKLSEGYTKQQLSVFLGLTTETIRRALRARCLMFPCLPETPLGENDRIEFNALAGDHEDE